MAIKKEDIKDLTTEELQEKVREEKARIQKARFNHAVTPLDNPVQLRYMRKDIARLMTELNNRKTAEKAS